MQTDIAKVTSDYPNGFRNISGDQVVENPQTIEFECKASVKDAVKCRVIKYSSNLKDIYSWEDEMLKTDDFDAASKKFGAIYNSLQHLPVNINGVNGVFKSEYTKPSESIKFTTLVFDAADKAPELKNLKISLSMENEMLESVIKIQVYEKEKDDKERGSQVDK